MPWKDARTHYQILSGGLVDVVQKFITTFWAELMVNNGIRVEYFPGFTTLQLCNKVQEFLSKMSEEPEDFTGRTI